VRKDSTNEKQGDSPDVILEITERKSPDKSKSSDRNNNLPPSEGSEDDSKSSSNGDTHQVFEMRKSIDFELLKRGQMLGDSTMTTTGLNALDNRREVTNIE
jgi:hypothetical protein